MLPEMLKLCTDYIFDSSNKSDKTMNFETIMFVEEENRSFIPVKTLFKPEQIISVMSAGHDCLYIENKDYIITEDGITPLENTSMPYFKYDKYYLKNSENSETTQSFPTADSRLVFGEGAYFHNKQIVISYRHSDAWSGPEVPDKSAKLPKIRKKIKDNKEINVLFNGDSISTGANSSGAKGIEAPPFMPPFPDLFAWKLENYYNIKVNLNNISVGGTASAWGIGQSYDYLSCDADNKPDLYIIGFGMNDGSGRIPVFDYISNIKKIITDARGLCPGCEFILLSTMLPNPILPGFVGYQIDYRQPLLNLENEFDGVAAADVTEIHKYLLTKKRYQDMTGNNVNHPNDFLARIYAQVLLKTLGV